MPLDDTRDRVVPNPNELDGCDVLPVSNLANRDNYVFIFHPQKALLLHGISYYKPKQSSLNLSTVKYAVQHCEVKMCF